MKKGKFIHDTRVVLSFALLGAVTVGAFLGWVDVDLRPYGAAAGAVGAIVLKINHLL